MEKLPGFVKRGEGGIVGTGQCLHAFLITQWTSKRRFRRKTDSTGLRKYLPHRKGGQPDSLAQWWVGNNSRGNGGGGMNGLQSLQGATKDGGKKRAKKVKLTSLWAEGDSKRTGGEYSIRGRV